jgi:tRNA threonylcarbamoyladenosine biosynthesis protein TsaB
MPSLNQIRAHFPALVIDAASAEIQVGWLRADTPPVWHTTREEAGTGVFAGVAQLGVDPGAAGCFVFCDGPGSVLGIRTAAMALRTWHVLRPRPVFAYSSLALVAHAAGRAETGYIADARRDSWHHYELGRGLRRVPTADLAGPLAMPENFRSWTPLPAGLASVPYRVADLLAQTADADLLRATDAPDAFLHEEPSYVTWTPQIHRAPGER